MIQCPRPDKRRYLTRADAKRDLKRARGRGMLLEHDLRAYQCECGMFHIGRLERAAIRLGRSAIHVGRPQVQA